MSTYNPWIATSTRRKNKPFNEAASAGGAKTPRVGVNKSDLEAQAAEHGWKPRPLDISEIQKMSSAEYHYHQVHNAENLQAALEQDANTRRNNEAMRAAEPRKSWNRYWNRADQPANEQEAAKHRAILDRFTKSFPQFITSRKEKAVVLEYLKQNDLAFTYENLVHAFEACVLAGTAWVNPSAIGAGPESEITGCELQNHRNVRLLMVSQSRPDVVSADDFYNSHPELHDRRTPPLVAAREAKAQATKELFERSETNTARAGATQVTTYADEQSGYPSAPTKYSFRKLLDSLSAEEFKDRINRDSSFAAAVDKLHGNQ